VWIVWPVVSQQMWKVKFQVVESGKWNCDRCRTERIRVLQLTYISYQMFWSTPWFVLVIIQFLCFLQTRSFVFVFQICICCCKSRTTIHCQANQCMKWFHLSCGRQHGPTTIIEIPIGNLFHLHTHTQFTRSQWLCGLRHGSASAYLLWLRIWITFRNEGVSVSCEFCVSSGRGICIEQITRLEKSYQICCLSVIPIPQQWGGLGPLGLCNYEKTYT
jgi:hypothetical protein